MKLQLTLSAVLLLAALAGKAQTASIGIDEGLRSEAPVKEETAKKFEPQKKVVNLYSRKEKGTLLVTSHRPQEVQLYIFDVEGTILYKTTLRKNEKTRITELAKGTYSYTIFDKDVSVEQGTLSIK